MSVIKSLQTWLEQYDGMQIRPLNEVLTDFTKDIPSSYAIARAGDSKTQTDIVGNRTYTQNYVFYTHESILDEVDREETHDFLESLTDWMEERAENDDYPIIPGTYSVDEINISNCLLHDVHEDGGGIYQVQIQIILTKWRQE